MTACLLCGQCCHFIIDGKLHKCKYLATLKSGKTLCRVYKTRLNRILFKTKDKIIRCQLRSSVSQNYPGCPYNTEEKNFLTMIQICNRIKSDGTSSFSLSIDTVRFWKPRVYYTRSSKRAKSHRLQTQCGCNRHWVFLLIWTKNWRYDDG